MKKTLLTAAISISLSACVATTQEQTAENVVEANSTFKQPSVVENKSTKKTKVPELLKPNTASNNAHGEITLEKIMSDPDWIGRAPESWYWGDDNDTVFFKQKRLGNPLRDLYVKDIKSSGNGEKVTLSKMHKVADRYAVKNNDGTKEVYTFSGNVFVKTIATGEVIQLTHTSANESAVMFLNDGAIAYRIGNKFYRHSLSSNQIIELANLLTTKNDEESETTASYLASEQVKLIEYLALQAQNKALKDEQQRNLRVKNSSITQTNFYFGENKKIVHAVLSPKGNKMLVSVADKKSTRAASDIMPNYISSDANIKAERVRARVADNRKYEEQLFVLDLDSGTKQALTFDALPGFDDDVLAEVRKENYARQGKTYTSKKAPRNIYVTSTRSAIAWNKSGSEVALFLSAWDHKDRWLATVNFEENKLVSHHRLHDDAWIPWTFNEFGWLNNTNSLYFLSEESGYSHLYVKPLTGKARAITSGNYEVSDLTLSQTEESIYFKGNQKHPGIYEIYRADLNNATTSALTDLGGMNSYRLSPDESKLLIEHSEVTMPPELYIKDLSNGTQAKRITHTVSEQFLSMPWVAPSVVAVESSHQQAPIYSRVYLPENYSMSAEKLRAVMFTHGAGYLQNAHLGWSGYFREFMFHSMLVQKGYAVIDMDYRASRGYGRDWRTAIYRQMGTPEVQDMRDGVNWLVENANVDRERIGTYGGSYGGFLTLMSMFNEPDLFQSGSALRLVSDWAYYNHGYTSRILNTPEDDPIAFERSSPIYFAEGLEKPLLINAPMIDDNVFFQDTVRLVQRLIELEKQDFETAIYPVEPHGFVQPSSWLNEYRRIFKLFETTL